MDNTVHDELGVGTKSRVKLILEDQLFIPFYNAMEKEDHTIFNSNITKEDFEELCDEFRIEIQGTVSNIQARIDALTMKRMIIINACFVLKFKLSLDMIDILKENGYKIEIETYKEDVDRIIKQTKRLTSKINQLTNFLPKKATSKKDRTAYDILVGISMNLEFGFSFEKCTVGAFIAYQGALEDKAKQLKSH